MCNEIPVNKNHLNDLEPDVGDSQSAFLLEIEVENRDAEFILA